MPKIADHFQRHGGKYAGGAAGLAMLTAAFTGGWEGFEPVAKHEPPRDLMTYDPPALALILLDVTALTMTFRFSPVCATSARRIPEAGITA